MVENNVIRSLLAGYNRILDEQIFSKSPYMETTDTIDILSIFCGEVIREISVVEGNRFVSKTRLRLLSEMLAKDIIGICNTYANDMIDNNDLK